MVCRVKHKNLIPEQVWHGPDHWWHAMLCYADQIISDYAKDNFGGIQKRLFIENQIKKTYKLKYAPGRGIRARLPGRRHKACPGGGSMDSWRRKDFPGRLEFGFKFFEQHLRIAVRAVILIPCAFSGGKIHDLPFPFFKTNQYPQGFVEILPIRGAGADLKPGPVVPDFEMLH